MSLLFTSIEFYENIVILIKLTFIAKKGITIIATVSPIIDIKTEDCVIL